MSGADPITSDLNVYQASWEGQSGSVTPSDYITWYMNLDTSEMTPEQKAKYEESVALMQSGSAADVVEGLQMMMELSAELGIFDLEGMDVVEGELDTIVSEMAAALDFFQTPPDGSRTHKSQLDTHSQNFIDGLDSLGLAPSASLQYALDKAWDRGFALWRSPSLQYALDNYDSSNPNAAQIFYLDFKIGELKEQQAQIGDPTSRAHHDIQDQIDSYTNLRNYYASPQPEDTEFWASTADVDKENYQGYSSAAWANQVEYYDDLAAAREAYLRGQLLADNPNMSEAEIQAVIDSDPFMQYYTRQSSFATEAYAKTAIYEFYQANPDATPEEVQAFIDSDPKLKAAIHEVGLTGRTTPAEFIEDGRAFNPGHVTYNYLKDSYESQSALYSTLRAYYTDLSSRDPENRSEFAKIAARYEKENLTAEAKLTRLQDLMEVIRDAIG